MQIEGKLECYAACAGPNEATATACQHPDSGLRAHPNCLFYFLIWSSQHLLFPSLPSIAQCAPVTHSMQAYTPAQNAARICAQVKLLSNSSAVVACAYHNPPIATNQNYTSTARLYSVNVLSIISRLRRLLLLVHSSLPGRASLQPLRTWFADKCSTQLCLSVSQPGHKRQPQLSLSIYLLVPARHLRNAINHSSGFRLQVSGSNGLSLDRLLAVCIILRSALAQIDPESAT